MRAAAHQRAAAATSPRSAAVAALRALLDVTLDGATRAAARLAGCSSRSWLLHCTPSHSDKLIK
eukprot:5990663-Prymnesium_polylepis.1